MTGSPRRHGNGLRENDDIAVVTVAKGTVAKGKSRPTNIERRGRHGDNGELRSTSVPIKLNLIGRVINVGQGHRVTSLKT